MVPGILGDGGIPKAPVTVAVALMCAVTTITMGLYSNRPFTLGPGLGVTAFLAVTPSSRWAPCWDSPLKPSFSTKMGTCSR